MRIPEEMRRRLSGWQADKREAGEDACATIIRQEKQDDYGEVDEMVKRSFAATDFFNGTEADYLTGLRNKSCFIPELPLVAMDGGIIVGQLALYRMQIDCGDRSIEPLVRSPSVPATPGGGSA